MCGRLQELQLGTACVDDPQRGGLGGHGGLQLATSGRLTRLQVPRLQGRA
jgi:hypothetical protein